MLNILLLNIDIIQQTWVLKLKVANTFQVANVHIGKICI